MRRLAITLGILTCGASAVALGLHANGSAEAPARTSARGEPPREADLEALRGPRLEACPRVGRRVGATEALLPPSATAIDLADEARAAADAADAAVRSNRECDYKNKLELYQQHRQAVLARLAAIARNPLESERARVLSLYLAAEVAPPGAHPTTAELLAESLGSGVPELRRQVLRLLADVPERVAALEPALRLVADGAPSPHAVEAARILVRWGLVRAGEVDAWLTRWVASGDAEVLDAAVEPDLLRGVESDALLPLLLPWIGEQGRPEGRVRLLEIARDFAYVSGRDWALVAARAAGPRTRERLLEAVRARPDFTPQTRELAAACLAGLEAVRLADLMRLAESRDLRWALWSCLIAEERPAPELVAAVLSRLSWREMYAWGLPWVRALTEARILDMQRALGREETVRLLAAYRHEITDPAAKALVTPPPQAPDEG